MLGVTIDRRTILGVLLWTEVIAALFIPIWILGLGLAFALLVLGQPFSVDNLIFIAQVVGGSLGAIALFRATYAVTFGDPPRIAVVQNYVFALCGLASLVSAAIQFEGFERYNLAFAGAVSIQIWCIWLVKIRQLRRAKELSRRDA